MACGRHLAAGNGEVTFIDADARGPALGYYLAVEDRHVPDMRANGVIVCCNFNASAAGDRKIVHSSNAVAEFAVRARTGDRVLP